MGPEQRQFTILLIDDEPEIVFSYELMFNSAGYTHVLAITDSRQAMPLMRKEQVSIVIVDLTMPHVSGYDLLKELHGEFPDLPVIIVTAANELDMAVECMKAGAWDYLVKPVEQQRLIASVGRAQELRLVQEENEALRERLLDGTLRNPQEFSSIVTRSPRMRSIFLYLESVATSGQPVLITGETGTGKELAARAIHAISRPRGPWVVVDVAGLDDEIFSDTMFGHVRGAFTGADQARSGMVEQAGGGTLFLDEIGALSLPSQVKLLRLLQDGEFLPVGSDKPRRADARIVVATNQDLNVMQAEGTFRKDLYYRLRTHHVHMPPLRERREDIPLLLACFLDEASRTLDKKRPTPPRELATLLATHHFPGNARELRAMVFDAVSTHQAKILSMDSFKRWMGRSEDEHPAARDHAPSMAAPTPITFSEQLPTISEAIRLLVAEAHTRASGNQGIMADMLGISRPAMNKRLKKLLD